MVERGDHPQQGDIVWLDFDPQQGREQRGRRPALVISHGSYNQKVGLALFCPITSKVKGYPFEVRVERGTISGVILADQVKSFDWRVRRVERIDQVDERTLAEVKERVLLLIE